MIVTERFYTALRWCPKNRRRRLLRERSLACEVDDREFFAAGACHVLAGTFLTMHPRAEFSAWRVRQRMPQRRRAHSLTADCSRAPAGAGIPMGPEPKRARARPGGSTRSIGSEQMRRVGYATRIAAQRPLSIQT